MIKVGDKVKVQLNSRLFSSCNDGKTGVVFSIDYTENGVTVRFEDGSVDYGRISDVSLVETAPVVTTTVQEKLDQIERLVSEIKTILGK